MFQALKVVRSQPNPLVHSRFPSLGKKTAVVRLPQAKCVSTQPESQDYKKMSNSQNPSQKTGRDVMSHSFGEAYATRSDEEGFGGVYEGKQSFLKPEDDKTVHENHPDYDKSQGSHVNEKEKGRHQADESKAQEIVKNK